MRLFRKKVINEGNIKEFINEKECIIPYYIKEIGADTFKDCDDLEKIRASSEKMCKMVCDNLKNIAGSENIKVYCNEKRFYNANNDGYLLINEKEIEGPFMYEESVEGLIAPCLIRLGRDSLKNCSHLRRIEVTSLKEVEPGAFDECKELIEITVDSGEELCRHIYRILPEDMRDKVKIYNGTDVWNGLNGLNGFIISDNKTIEENKFKGRSDLIRVELLSAEVLKECSFYGCENLELVKLPTTNETIIEKVAFKECSKLEYINLGKVTSIGSYAFAECENLKLINLSSAKEIGGGAFENCKSLQMVDLSFVEKLGAGVFSGCESIKEVILGDSLTEVFMQTFDNCKGLEKINLEKVEKIYTGAFSGCQSLKTIDLSSVIEICDDAFAQCINLEEINLYSIKEISTYNPFRGCDNLKLIRTTKEKEKMIRKMIQSNDVNIITD